MAEALPSPPPSGSATPELQHESDDLAQKLDGLLEKYLELLDQYTILHEELSKTFSVGFFSLAQAQRTSTLGAGRRYGQDFYDQRMKAHRKVTVSSNEKDQSTVYAILTKTPAKDSGLSTAGKKESADVESHKKPDSEDVKDSSDKSEKEEQEVKNADSKQSSANRDPITWFGILVPPALRRTQSQFIAAIKDVIPKLLSIQAQMRATEARIEALRAQLQHSAEGKDVHDDQTERSERSEQKLGSTPNAMIAQEQKRSDSRRKFASRPPHSKAPLLQLDR